MPRTRSLPQGDPSAPVIFNVILDALAEKFLEAAAGIKRGKELSDGSWVNRILFADNYWLVATSPSMLKDMANEWLRVLGEVGWETATADLTWCATEKDLYKADIVVNGETTLRAEAKVGLKAFGTLVTLDSNFDVEIENRLARATRACHANWDMLGCVSIPLTETSTGLQGGGGGVDV